MVVKYSNFIKALSETKALFVFDEMIRTGAVDT